MKFGAAILLLFIPKILMYHQSDFILITERAEIVSYDHTNVNFVKTKNFRFNRTHTGINFTMHFAKNFGNGIRIAVQANKFMSNEYRLFPATFEFNLCNYLTTNTFGIGNLYDCGNFSKCPMVKGSYVICNWAPDYSQFPPFIPGGRYMVDLHFVYDSKDIIHMQAYGEVKPKNKWELKK